MGGNVTIDGVNSSPVKITKESRWQLVDLIYEVTYLLGPVTPAGSTSHLFDWSITDDELCRHMPMMGDLDFLMGIGYKDLLLSFLREEKTVGQFSIIGSHSHGTTVSVLMKNNKSREVSQWDFTFVPDINSLDYKFLHSSNWADIQNGLKGVHHKLLLNAIATADDMKFSISHGLRPRFENENWQTTNPYLVGRILRQSENIWCAYDMIRSINDDYSIAKANFIRDKFRKSCGDTKNVNHSQALALING